MATKTPARKCKVSIAKGTEEVVGSFPKFLIFKSDESVCELQDTVTERKKDKKGKFVLTPTVGRYQFIKAKYHVDDRKEMGLPPTTVDFTMDRVNEMIFKQIITTAEVYGGKK